MNMLLSGASIIIIMAIIILILLRQLYVTKTDYRKLLTQKKKSEVNLGYVAEKLAPFLQNFNFEPERLIFVGKPIDYIHFGNDDITFIEVKSGNSRLSKGQRKIKNLIKEHKIKWCEYRVSNKQGEPYESAPIVQQ